jgi:putative DNA primase/helicase
MNALEELQQYPHWVAWRPKQVNGHVTKVPYVVTNGHLASATNPKTWRPYDDAAKAYKRAGHAGLGFVLGTSGMCGIDLDKCRDPKTGKIERWAGEIVARFNSYTEVTPSGAGVRIWIKGKLADGARNRKANIEVYDRKRYFTWTGQHLVGTPRTIEARQDQLDKWHAETFGKRAERADDKTTAARSDEEVLNAAKGDATLQRLLNGDVSGYASKSEADLACVSRLTDHTRDREQLRRLWLNSGLARAKLERLDYVERTLDRALTDRFAEFFSKKGFIPPRMGEYLKLKGRIRKGHDGRLYRYHDGVYQADASDWVGNQMRLVLGDLYRKRQREEVNNWLASHMPEMPLVPSVDVINLSNGLLDWRTGELSEHDPAVPSTIRIPHRWNPKAKCPAIDSFLRDVLPLDCVEFAVEIIGYCLIPDNSMQRAVMLVGTGGNGKGTLLNLIKSLLGPHNVAVRSLHDLSEDRFAKADLFGKLANICGDLDARQVERSDVFKMITGGDAISGERKYGQSFDFLPFARMLFSANEVPPSADQTLAYFDRWLPVPMTKRIRGTKREVQNMIGKLATAQELEGLLVRAVAGLKRLMARGHFEVPETVMSEHARFREHVDTVLAFGKERITLDARGWVSRSALYNAYVTWCMQNGRKPLSARNVYTKLAEQFPSMVDRNRSHSGGRGFTGITMGETKLEKSVREVNEKRNSRK